MVERGPNGMHLTRWAATACALAAAGLAGVGCGGGDALAKKDLAAKANQICAKYSKEGDKLKAPSDISDPKQAQAFFAKAHDIAKRQQDDLEALTAADDVKTAYADMTQATGKATTLLGDLEAAAKAKDAAKGAKLLQQLQPDSQAVDRTAKAVGATGCAS
jgi:hypothetical protein